MADITLGIVNNQVVLLRRAIRLAKTEITKKLVRNCRKIKQSIDSKLNEINIKQKEAKLKKVLLSILEIKKVDHIEAAKFCMLNDCSPGEMSNVKSLKEVALARISNHHLIKKSVSEFRLKYPSWKTQLPSIYHISTLKDKKNKKKSVKSKTRKRNSKEKSEIAAQRFKQKKKLTKDKEETNSITEKKSDEIETETKKLKVEPKSSGITSVEAEIHCTQVYKKEDTKTQPEELMDVNQAQAEPTTACPKTLDTLHPDNNDTEIKKPLTNKEIHRVSTLKKNLKGQKNKKKSVKTKTRKCNPKEKSEIAAQRFKQKKKGLRKKKLTKDKEETNGIIEKKSDEIETKKLKVEPKSSGITSVEAEIHCTQVDKKEDTKTQPEELMDVNQAQAEPTTACPRTLDTLHPDNNDTEIKKPLTNTETKVSEMKKKQPRQQRERPNRKAIATKDLTYESRPTLKDLEKELKIQKANQLYKREGEIEVKPLKFEDLKDDDDDDGSSEKQSNLLEENESDLSDGGSLGSEFNIDRQPDKNLYFEVKTSGRQEASQMSKYSRRTNGGGVQKRQKSVPGRRQKDSITSTDFKKGNNLKPAEKIPVMNRKMRRQALRESGMGVKSTNSMNAPKLHPSWQAKKQQKSTITSFLGKKMTFTD